MTSLRQQLARKSAHSTSLTFPLGEEGERAKAELDAAEQGLKLVQALHKDASTRADVEKAAKQRLAKAEREYAKHSVTIRFRGLTDEERDALISAHPPTPEQEVADQGKPEEERASINRATFTPAALAVCALDSDLTEEEWTAELTSDRWTAGEKLALYKAIVAATNAEPAPGLPKGSAATR